MANAAFTALLAEVYKITAREDLTAETSLAVRAATLKLHQSDFYPRDLVEAKLQFSVPGYYQSLAYKSLFPRFRALKYARKYESGEPTKFLTVLSPDNILDAYGVSKENVCYMAGEVIQIRSDTELEELLMGFYQNPVTTEDDYASWINDLHPFAIITEAAHTIFKMVGFDEQAATYQRLAGEQALLVKNFNILAEG